jgi:hypothetical protein
MPKATPVHEVNILLAWVTTIEIGDADTATDLQGKRGVPEQSPSLGVGQSAKDVIKENIICGPESNHPLPDLAASPKQLIARNEARNGFPYTDSHARRFLRLPASRTI